MTTVSEVPMGTLSKKQARELTDEVKADAHTLWTKLLRLFEGDAHKALGYKTWGQYYEAEFGGSANEGKRMLAAGRVLESLEPAGFRGEGSVGSPLLNERAARELQPLLRQGADAVREAYEDALEVAGGEKPTARQVREVVQLRREPPAPQPPARPALEVLPPPTPLHPPAPPTAELPPEQPPEWFGDISRFASDMDWWLTSQGRDPEENATAAKGLLERWETEIAPVLRKLTG